MSIYAKSFLKHNLVANQHTTEIMSIFLMTSTCLFTPSLSWNTTYINMFTKLQQIGLTFSF